MGVQAMLLQLRKQASIKFTKSFSISFISPLTCQRERESFSSLSLSLSLSLCVLLLSLCQTLTLSSHLSQEFLAQVTYSIWSPDIFALSFFCVCVEVGVLYISTSVRVLRPRTLVEIDGKGRKTPKFH